MNYIDIWGMLEDIVENHEGPYCFEEAELEEIRQLRRVHISESSKRISEAMRGVFSGR